MTETLPLFARLARTPHIKVADERLNMCWLTGYCDRYGDHSIVDRAHIVDDELAEGAAKYDPANRLCLR